MTPNEATDRSAAGALHAAAYRLCRVCDTSDPLLDDVILTAPDVDCTDDDRVWRCGDDGLLHIIGQQGGEIW